MIRTLILLIASLTVAPAVAAALNVPDASTSTTPRNVVFCPGGDLDYTVIVRDFAYNTIQGSVVTLDFFTCLPHCPQPFPSGVTDLTLDETNNNHRVSGVTGPNGVVVVRVKAGGGTCPAALAIPPGES